ncbi:MAG TPA: phosphatidylserine decarboxylase [Bacteroidales bacterium]|nr:phosphatidylserine decarboxylase [Bacteroidales bacterium]
MIKIYDRKNKTLMEEKVVGGKLLELLYGKVYGKPFLYFVRRKFFSKMYGRLMDTKRSKKMIRNFIQEHQIDMDEALEDISSYRTFNEFFARKLKPEARPFDSDPRKFCSPSDSRLLVFEDITADEVIQVKGMTYSLKELIKNEKVASEYEGGTVMVFRLNPLDYHRFHFVDDGIAYPARNIDGQYYSVNPVALKVIPRVYVENRRSITKFESRNFGTILYVEVGATNVGTIIQTYTESGLVEKGSEQGYFKFGGSTVILFLKKGQVKVSSDILEASASGIETRVLCGETIGVRPN